VNKHSEDNVTPFPSKDKPSNDPAEELISQHLRIRQNGYITTPDKGKEIHIPGWPDICRHADEATIRDLIAKYPDHSNIGIMSIGVLPIDVDIDDKTIAQKTEDYINKAEGPSTLKRLSKSPRRLLLYGWNGPVKARHATAILYGEKLHVEILAQKFTAFGTHPSGKPYDWEGKSPLDFPRDQLLTFGSGGALADMDEARLKTLLDGILGLWRSYGAGTQEEIEGFEREAERLIGGEAKDKPGLIAAIMGFLKNTFPLREDWYRIGQSVYNELGDAAYETWVKFSREWPQNTPEAIAQMWKSFKKERRGPRLTYKTLIRYAQQQGWTVPPQFRSERKGKEQGLPPPAPLLIVRMHELQGKTPKPKRFLVADWWLADSIQALYGPAGGNKTRLNLQLQTALALGKHWLGLAVSGPLRTLGLYCEESEDDLHLIQEAINRHYHCEMSDLGLMTCLAHGERGENALVWIDQRHQMHTTPFHKLLLDQIRDEKAELVLLDNVAHTYPGDENDRAMVTRYLDIAERPLRQAAGALIHTRHTSVAGEVSGRSGSTGWDAGEKVKGHVALVEPKNGVPDPDARVIRRVKTNWARIGGDIAMHWRNGVLVPDFIDESAKPSVEVVFMRLLDKVAERGGNLSAVPNAPNYAPRMFERMAGNEGHDRFAFARALEKLLEEDHAIEIEEYTRDRHTYYKIVRAKTKAADNGSGDDGVPF
jgi:hypothetical protein